MKILALVLKFLGYAIFFFGVLIMTPAYLLLAWSEMLEE